MLFWLEPSPGERRRWRLLLAWLYENCRTCRDQHIYLSLKAKHQIYQQSTLNTDYDPNKSETPWNLTQFKGRHHYILKGKVVYKIPNNFSTKWIKTRRDYSDVSLWYEKLGRFSSFTCLSLTLPALEFNLRKPGGVGRTAQAEFLPLAPATNKCNQQTNKNTNKQTGNNYKAKQNK